MTNLVYLSDIHLNFLSDTDNRVILNHVVANCAPGDTVVITGDIAEAPTVVDFMTTWKTRLEAKDIKLRFVLGNHDYYHGSVDQLRADMKQVLPENWLGNCDVVELSEKTALVGHDGWYDGLYADYLKSRLDMSDYYLIKEISGFAYNRPQRHKILQRLATEAATHILTCGRKALEDKYEKVFIATHVPPWKEASWFKGKPSDNDWLPHFSSKIMGDAIILLGKQFPNKKITVLCGHTHVGESNNHICNPLPNIECHTAAAEYRYPKISDIFTIE